MELLDPSPFVSDYFTQTPLAFFALQVVHAVPKFQAEPSRQRLDAFREVANPFALSHKTIELINFATRSFTLFDSFLGPRNQPR